MTDETAHIATAAAALDDPYAALSQHLHGDGEIDRGRIKRLLYENTSLTSEQAEEVMGCLPPVSALMALASPQRDAEVRRAALEEAAQEADDWFYDAEKDCVTECRLGNAIRALIDPPPRDADTCATDGCTNRPVIRLDDHRLCGDCYTNHDFGDDA